MSKSESELNIRPISGYQGRGCSVGVSTLDNVSATQEVQLCRCTYEVIELGDVDLIDLDDTTYRLWKKPMSTP